MSNISQRLNLRQSQSLVMTPQLQQAIKLLQFSNAELTEFVEEELAQNPLLEKDKGDDKADDSEKESQASTETDAMQDDFDQSWTGNESATASAPSGGQDFDPGSSMANMGAGGNRNFDDVEQSFENSMSKPVTLREHLQAQLSVAFSDPRDLMVGAQIIDLLDEGGYLRHGIDEIVERLDCKAERVEKLVTQMRGFDPTGVFARDLQDCMALQLEEQGLLDDPMKLFLQYLDLLADHDHVALAKKCKVNETYLQDMIGDLKALNPKPASDFDHLVVQTAVPDVLMKRLPKDLGGGWRVELNNDTLPKVLVNQQYYTEVAGKAKDKKDKTYLNEQMQSANWLVKAMDQRAKTILKVAGEIIEQQHGFFLYGIEFLKPLTLKDIAEKIDMHESTVSRVTTNKYMGTPRGIFELKYFFSTALGEGDNVHSSETVKARIKTMIDEEDPQKVLSDDKIVAQLQAGGVDIARRTVAKYREAMHIPSSVQRRKQKKNQS